jgi:hypothetical protein
MMRGEEIIHWLGRPFEPILFSFFVLPGPAVDDDDDVKGRRGKSMLGPRHGAHTCIRLPVPIAGEDLWKERMY